MPNIVDRWAEHKAGTLTPPVLIQVDQPYEHEYLIWLYTVNGVVGPWSRRTYDPVTTLAEIVTVLTEQEEAENAEEALA